MYCEPKELILKSILSSLLSIYWENQFKLLGERKEVNLVVSTIACLHYQQIR